MNFFWKKNCENAFVSVSSFYLFLYFSLLHNFPLKFHFFISSLDAQASTNRNETKEKSRQSVDGKCSHKLRSWKSLSICWQSFDSCKCIRHSFVKFLSIQGNFIRLFSMAFFLFFLSMLLALSLLTFNLFILWLGTTLFNHYDFFFFCRLHSLEFTLNLIVCCLHTRGMCVRLPYCIVNACKRLHIFIYSWSDSCKEQTDDERTKRTY